jgi:hypothetical protein
VDDGEAVSLLLAFALFIQNAVGLQPIVASRLSLSKPVVVAELSGDRLPGFPLRLTWSPNGRELYLRLVRQDRWGNETTWHVGVALADSTVRPLDREPAWSQVYWAWKSASACPGVPAFVVDIETQTQVVSPTAAGAGGSIAQNSGDPYGPGFELGPQGQAIIARAMQSQTVTTVWMRAKGQLVSQFVNARPIQGLLFGWTPEGMGGLAYADEKRRLVVMDREGHRHQARDAKGVLLPAWSPDGTRLAWLEQSAARRFTIRIADVTMHL